MNSLLVIVSGEIIASIVGLFYIRSLSKPFKLILLKVVIALLIQSLAEHYAIHGQNNLWIFNFYMLIELWLLGIAGRMLSINSFIKKAIPFLLLIITAIWVYDVYKDGLFVLANGCFLSASFFYLIVYTPILFSHSTTNKSITKDPVFWLCIAILVYYGCDIPYKSLENYLVVNNMKLARFLFHINFFLNIASNLAIAVGFYLLGRQKRNLADV